MKILNLTQHSATKDQIEAGVVELQQEEKKVLADLLTFEEIPTSAEMESRARKIVVFVDDDIDAVMIGGAPYFMPPLQKALQKACLKVLYAFSKREVIEKQMEDGSVQKSQVFKHVGFVEA